MSFCVDDIDLENGKAWKERENSAQFVKLPKIHNRALLSGLAYCISSCSMILVNKFVLSGYGLNAPIFLMLYQVYYQCFVLTIYTFHSHATHLYSFLTHIFHDLLLQNIVSVAIVSTLSLSSAVSTELLAWNLIKVWFLLISFLMVCWSQACLGMWQIFSISLALVLSVVHLFRSIHQNLLMDYEIVCWL